MSKKKRWSNIRERVHLEIGETVGEVTIFFVCSGYDDPGITTGPAEKCYPPESDEERIVTGITVGNVDLPDDVVRELENEKWVQEAIYSVVIDPADYEDCGY